MLPNEVVGVSMDEGAYLLTPEGKIVDLGGVVSIGRHHTNVLVVNAPKVSRHHCSIVRVPNGFQLVDNQSTNGTYLNGARVGPPQMLKHFDVIVIGNVTLRFMSPLSHDASQAPLVTSGYEQTATSLDVKSCWMMVADIIDSTQILRNKGAEFFSEIRRLWFRECHAILKRTQGHFNQSTGDGFLAIWEDSENTFPLHVVEAIQDVARLQSSYSLPFRLAFHTGQVTIGGVLPVWGEPLAGPEVHFAFRLEKVGADLGVPLVFSEAAAKRLMPHLPLIPKGLHSFKGFDTQSEVFVLDPDQAPTVSAP